MRGKLPESRAITGGGLPTRDLTEDLYTDILPPFEGPKDPRPNIRGMSEVLVCRILMFVWSLGALIALVYTPLSFYFAPEAPDPKACTEIRVLRSPLARIVLLS